MSVKGSVMPPPVKEEVREQAKSYASKFLSRNYGSNWYRARNDFIAGYELCYKDTYSKRLQNTMIMICAVTFIGYILIEYAANHSVHVSSLPMCLDKLDDSFTEFSNNQGYTIYASTKLDQMCLKRNK